MDVFELRDRLIGDYRDYMLSFVQLKDDRVRQKVDEAIEAGVLWPEPLIQMNPAFESGGSSVQELCDYQLGSCHINSLNSQSA